ncbi:MAG: hypothetical protein FJ279_21515 [Planctomycetes bacterium]|nr:hypothetical protein [Planctomycetota bacterium]MBM4081216.1 hypothetical protein [Planctomycetota bacterium]
MICPKKLKIPDNCECLIGVEIGANKICRCRECGFLCAQCATDATIRQEALAANKQSAMEALRGLDEWRV